MSPQPCPNYNHSVTNAPMRGCPLCGEILNATVKAIECGKEEHRRRRKDGDRFCTHCALALQ